MTEASISPSKRPFLAFFDDESRSSYSNDLDGKKLGNHNFYWNYPLHFRVETIDGSAVEGEDYEPVNEILTFEPHEREKEVSKIRLNPVIDYPDASRTTNLYSR